MRKILRLPIVALAFVSPFAMAQTAVDTMRTIRVVMDNDYAPFVFQSDNGKLQGILIDQWEEWEKKTGIKAEIHAMDWGEALRRMRAGEFDVIDCIVKTTERQDYFDFTPAYNSIEASIFFRNDISGITDLASVKGFPVGVKTGDQHIDYLRARGVTTILTFPNNETIIKAAREHKINVFLIDDPSALYLLNKMGIEAEFRHSPPIFRDELRRAVRKGNTATLNIVTDGFAAIGPDRLKQIDEKWFGKTINRYGSYLRYLTYAVYVGVVAILLIAGLALWNRTLRKRVLQRTAALRQSEDRIRLIIDTIPIMAWSTLPDGTVDFVNQRWLDYTGEKGIEDPSRVVHPEDRTVAVEIWFKKMTAEKPTEDEMRLRGADGKYRWFLVRTAPLHNEQGNLVKWYGVSIDIEDSKRAEDELRKSEDRIRLIIDTIPIMAWTFQPDGSVDFANQRWLDYAGEDAFADPNSIIHPEDVPGVMENWFLNKVAEKSYEDEMRLRRADGEYRWFRVRTAPLHDEQGNVVKWYGVSIDIEDSKRAEDELRLAYQRLSYHVENTPLAIIEFDKDLFIKRWSKRAEKIFGWKASEALGKNVYDADFPIIYKDDIPAVDKINEQLMKGSVNRNISFNRNYTKDGNIIYSEWYNSVLKNDHGKVITILSLVHNVTERKKAEEQKEFEQRDKEALINTTDDMIWSISRDLKLIAVNKAFIREIEALTGITVKPGDDVLMADVVPRDIVVSWKEDYNRTLAGESFKKDIFIPAFNKSAERWKETSFNPIYKDQTVVALACYSRDITERKSTEETLQRSYEEIRRLTEHLQNIREEERIHIAREIHDELGQQLTAVKMDVAWIDKKTPEETIDIKRKLKNIIELLDGSNQSVRRILSELRPRILDDHGLLEAIEWLGRQFSETTGIPVKFTTPEKDIKVSEQMATCAFRVCQEAFTNITRYALAKNVLISISIVEENIILMIEDDGIGFQAAAIKNKKSFGILGMKERVLSLGGKFKLVSSPGKGTKIIVSLSYNA